MKQFFFSLVLFIASPVVAEPISASRIEVLDGDTIRVDGNKPDVRLVGFNTPETIRAKSAKERELGEKALDRLRKFVRSAKVVDLSYVACACRPGTEGTQSCNFGRKCGRLTTDGKNVGDILIGEGLAVSFICGATSCPRTSTPWRE